MRCLGCGNKAKRDCLYYRCRSCCKGNGFQCQTHIKSTWVPISTRQVVRNSEAAAMAAPSAAADPPHQQEEHQQLYFSSPSSSGFGGHFPTEVRGQATFTCVRVTTTTLEENNVFVDQSAYETTINIGGHVFRGILYDQGPADHQHINSDINVPSDLQPAGY
ncbi:hypothetical protein SSX86_021098 [Deinandra increscens subsp. villosa]|uniref:Uncharacterized protein n=1 Tax=Deinandra increscens subsp. villosa TaxID=3103831 RepID=A0AAP0CP87_9ASTR